MREGGKRRYRTAKIILLISCLLLAAVLAAGMIMNAGKADRGAGHAGEHSRSYQNMANQTGEHLQGAVDTARAKIKADRETAEKAQKEKERQASVKAQAKGGAVSWNSGWQYAQFSKIHSGQAVLYKSTAAARKDIVVGVNAGHGTAGGASVKTQCHPDGSAKVVTGSTAAGETMATAVSYGATLADGTSEADAVLALAQVLREDLLAAGSDVLMLRDGKDVQLDNIARAVMANNNADCHISLHYDSSQSDKGFFYISVPDAASYRSMEPVASHWREHNKLGESLLAGARSAGIKIMGSGSMAIDLTQTSYSTIPSVDVEVGDRASDHSPAAIARLSKGIAAGIEEFF